MKPLGFNTAGTEQVFERMLEQSVDRCKKTGDLFVYLEIGLAEGTTLLSVADYLQQQTDLYWNAIGIDLFNGPYFNAQTFLTKAADKNVELIYLGDANKDTMDFSVRDMLNVITIALMPEGETIAEHGFPPDSIDFCVIDGCHGAPCVERDFLAIESKIKPGGIVAFHDAMPEDQGIGWQEHCQQNISVLKAMEKLQLAYPVAMAGPGGGWRPGWNFIDAVHGDKTASQPGNGFAFFQKV